MMQRTVQQGGFVIRMRYLPKIGSFFRRIWLGAWGLRVGRGTVLPPVKITWPHQVRIGRDCVLESDIYFKFDGIWKPGPSIHIGNRVFIGTACEFNIRCEIYIGDSSLIASGCKFIDHDHGVKVGQPIGKQTGEEKAIRIGRDVWIGCNVVVLKGLTIEDGAIIGAGSVVTKRVPSNEIWAGVPARKIGQRP